VERSGWAVLNKLDSALERTEAEQRLRLKHDLQGGRAAHRPPCRAYWQQQMMSAAPTDAQTRGRCIDRASTPVSETPKPTSSPPIHPSRSRAAPAPRPAGGRPRAAAQAGGGAA
jgi:hypothetical protein